jgi:hypothetical protein
VQLSNQGEEPSTLGSVDRSIARGAFRRADQGNLPGNIHTYYIHTYVLPKVFRDLNIFSTDHVSLMFGST